MDKVSVIVPVYNKEKELERCLLSIVTQTYKNLEIIVIDDGSTDGSYNIYTDFANKDKRIKIIRKKNEGVDCARHTGIEIATGDYVTFVDSDDYLYNKAVELLIVALKTSNADVSFGNFTRVIGKHGIVKKSNGGDIFNNNIILQDELIDKYLKSFCGWGDLPINMCGKLYKMELVKDVPVTKLVYGEDLCFNLYVLPKAKKIVSIPNSIYFYVYGGVTTNVDEERMYEDAIKQYNYKVSEFKKYGQFNLIEMANVELCNYFIGYVDIVIAKFSTKKAKDKIVQYLSSPILQNACNDVSYNWFNNELKYQTLMRKDVDSLFKERKKIAYKNKIKTHLLKLIEKIL